MSKEQRRNANKLTNLLETAKKYNKNRNIFLFIKWNIIQEMKKNIVGSFVVAFIGVIVPLFLGMMCVMSPWVEITVTGVK